MRLLPEMGMDWEIPKPAAQLQEAPAQAPKVLSLLSGHGQHITMKREGGLGEAVGGVECQLNRRELDLGHGMQEA